MTDLPKPNTRIRGYLIEVKNPQGKSAFFTVAYWDEQDKRVAIAQIMRLADTPEATLGRSHRVSLNLARPLALLIEVKDAETGASDARLIQTSRARPVRTPIANAKDHTD